MRSLGDEVTALAPFIFSEKAFLDPVNAPEIQSRLVTFSQVAHEISPDRQIGRLDADPSLKFAAAEMKNNLVQAVGAFTGGQKPYARHVVKSVLNQCFYCHTRNQFGPQLSQGIVSDERLKKLDPIERADLYVALRDYDTGLKVLKDYLSRPSVKDLGFGVDHAIQRYLAVAVRVKKDPELALEGVAAVLNRADAPFYLKQDARSWKSALEAWRRERHAQGRDPLLQAKSLLNHRSKDRDGGSSIEILRASALLHDYLQVGRAPESSAEALYLLGQAYEAMRDFGSTFLSEFYYESCIRQLPHSLQSEKCYRSFEESIYRSFSGSSGTFVPDIILEKMRSLRQLALRSVWPTDV